MDTLFQIPGEISKVSSMANRSLRLHCDTQENLTDEQMAKTMAMLNKFGWFTFSPDLPIGTDALVNLPPAQKDDDGKSPAQRLRGVIFILWEQGGKKGDSFETYYRARIENIINQIKEKLT